MGKYFDKLIRMNESLSNKLADASDHVFDTGLERNLHAAGLSVIECPGGIEVYLVGRDLGARDTFERLCEMAGISNELKDMNTSNTPQGNFVVSAFLPEEDKVEVTEGDDGDTVSITKDMLTDDQKKDMLLKNGLDKKVVDGMSSEEMDGALAASENELKNEAVDRNDAVWDGPAIIKVEDFKTDMKGYYVKDGEWSTDMRKAFIFPDKDDAYDKVDELVDEKGFDRDTLWVWSAKMIEQGDIYYESEDVSEEVVIRMDDDDLDIHGYVKWDIAEKVDFVDDINDADVFQHEELANNKIEEICQKFHYDPETFSTKSLDPRADEPYDEGLDLYSPDEDTFKDYYEKWVSLDPMHPSATTIG